MSSDNQLVSSADKPPPYHRYPKNPHKTQKITQRIKARIGGEIHEQIREQIAGHWVGTIIALLTLLLPLLAVIKYSSGQPRGFTPSESTVNLSQWGGYESASDP